MEFSLGKNSIQRNLHLPNEETRFPSGSVNRDSTVVILSPYQTFQPRRTGPFVRRPQKTGDLVFFCAQQIKCCLLLISGSRNLYGHTTQRLCHSFRIKFYLRDKKCVLWCILQWYLQWWIFNVSTKGTDRFLSMFEVEEGANFHKCDDSKEFLGYELFAIRLVSARATFHLASEIQRFFSHHD